MHPHTQRSSPATDSRAPSPSRGGLLASLSLHTSICTHSPVHTLARSHRGCPASLELTHTSTAQFLVLCPWCPGRATPSRRLQHSGAYAEPAGSLRSGPLPGPAGVPVAWPFFSKATMPSSGDSRLQKPGVRRAVTRRGPRRALPDPRTPGRGRGRQAPPGTQASDHPEGAWGRTLAPGPLSPARTTQGGVALRGRTPPSRLPAQRCRPRAKPSGAAAAPLSAAAPGVAAPAQVRAWRALAASEGRGRPEAASGSSRQPAARRLRVPSRAPRSRLRGPGRAARRSGQGHLQETGSWGRPGGPSRVRDAQVLRKVENGHQAEGSPERGPGGGPASAPRRTPNPPTRGRAGTPASPALAREGCPSHYDQAAWRPDRTGGRTEPAPRGHAT